LFSSQCLRPLYAKFAAFTSIPQDLGRKAPCRLDGTRNRNKIQYLLPYEQFYPMLDAAQIGGASSGHEISLGRFSPPFQRCCGGAQLSNSPTKNDPFLCVAIFVRILELKSESCAVEEHADPTKWNFAFCVHTQSTPLRHTNEPYRRTETKLESQHLSPTTIPNSDPRS
jgi:hypothetical protein